MDKIEIYSSKRKSLLLLLGSTLFLIGGFDMLMNAETFNHYQATNKHFTLAIGIGSILFFGLGIFVSIRQLIQDRLILTIDKTGLNVDPNNSKSRTIEWKNIEGFSELKIRSSRFIIINVNNSDYWIAKEENIMYKKLMKFNFDTYGSPFNVSAHAMQINHVKLKELLHQSWTTHKLLVSNGQVDIFN